MQINYRHLETENEESKKYCRENIVKARSKQKFVIDIKIIYIRAALTSTAESLPFQTNDYAFLK